MKAPDQNRPTRLRSTLAYLDREAARRAKGAHPGMMRFQDDELRDLIAILQREVGAVPAEEPAR